MTAFAENDGGHPFALRLIAAPFTPFAPDGSLNLELIGRYADFLQDSGVSGVFICGTTGEGMSLTCEERMLVAEEWTRMASGRLEVIVHVGHPSVGEARHLAAHAEKIGADGIASIGPVFYAPANAATWVETCRQIAAAARETPFYYYHMPSMSRIGFAASSFFEQLENAVPTFRGVKFTHEDLDDYRKCLSLAGGRREVFFGRDELLLEGLQLGAKSAVGSTYNFAAPLYLQTARLFHAGKIAEARANQALCTEAIETMIRLGGMAAIRAALGLRGIDCGPMRLPLAAVSPSVRAALARELGALSYFKAIQEAMPVIA